MKESPGNTLAFLYLGKLFVTLSSEATIATNGGADSAGSCAGDTVPTNLYAGIRKPA